MHLSRFASRLRQGRQPAGQRGLNIALALRHPDSLLSVVQRLRLITFAGVVDQVVGLVVLVVIIASLRPFSGLLTLVSHFVMVAPL